jgi:hypothetical protein
MILDKNLLLAEASIRKRGGGRQEQNTSKYRELQGKQIGQKRNPLGREIQARPFALSAGENWNLIASCGKSPLSYLLIKPLATTR